jgi:hypothetical protein
MTFRLVAQRLNKLCNRGPHLYEDKCAYGMLVENVS